MRFRELAKGTRAVKPTRFRFANAPAPIKLQQGEELPAEDEHTVSIGLRVLTAGEISSAYSNAQAAAKDAGQKEWVSGHPLCRLHEMVQILAIACVDADSPADPFFASADEILKSPEIGEDNIAYLYELYLTWQGQCSVRTEELTVDQVIGLLLVEAERPENAESPLAFMRPASRASFMRITAQLFSSLVKARLVTTSSSDTSGQNFQTPGERSEG